MKKPEIPKNEAQRIYALKAYGILDTDVEKTFDDITKLAAQISGMPISLISLLDEKRQWFKSHFGLSASETSREISFCGHAINKPNEVLIIPNTHKDERFFDNPLVSGDPNIGFYAGAPIVSPEGFALGTICVIDNKPNNLNPEQIESLKILSQQVVFLLEFQKNKKKLTQEKKNYKQLFKYSPDAFIVIGPNGFYDCNTKFLELFKIKSKSKFLKLYPGDISPKTQPCGEDSSTLGQSLFEKTLSGVSQKFMWEHKKSNGKIFSSKVSLVKITIDGKDLVQASITDLTEEVKQEELIRQSKEKFLQVSSNLLDGIILINEKGNITLWNKSAERIFGFKEEEVLGKDMHSFLMPKRYASAMHGRFTQFLKSGEGPLIGNTTQIEALHKSGHEISISISISGFKVNNKWNASASIRDITQEKIAIQKLELSEEKFRAISDSSLNGIYELNMRGEFVYMNEAMIKILNYKKNELNGKPYQFIIAKNDILQSESYFKEIISGKPIQNELSFRRQDGSIFPGYFSIVPLKKDNVVFGLSGSLIDLTESVLNKQEIINTAKELRLFIETANAPIFGIDTDGNVNEWNKTAEKITGFKKQEVLGSNMVEVIITEDYQNAVQRVLDNALKGKETSNYKFPLFTKSNKKVIVLLNASTRRDAFGNIVGVIGVGQDISELDAYKNNLENTVKKRTLELENGLEREKELGQLKSRFVSMASHEFRTPLASIQATTDVILNYGKKLSQQDIDKRLIKIIQEVNDMTALLEDILIIGKSEVQKLEFNTTALDFVELIKTIISEYQLTQTIEREVVFKLHTNKIMLEVDPKWIKNIVINLFSNALKYSKVPASIGIEIQKTKNEVILSVSDKGIGISEKDKAYLFQPFHRGENVSSIHGTGLGLSVVEKAVNLHHGKIKVISEINKGTEIKISFPIKVKS